MKIGWPSLNLLWHENVLLFQIYGAFKGWLPNPFDLLGLSAFGRRFRFGLCFVRSVFGFFAIWRVLVLMRALVQNLSLSLRLYLPPFLYDISH